jgi:hypothetical protein
MSDDPDEPSIWRADDPEFHEKYPHYAETMRMLEAVLDLAQLKGVTPPEFAAILATLHSRVIAWLRPTDEQLESAISAFRAAVKGLQKDVDTANQPPV